MDWNRGVEQAGLQLSDANFFLIKVQNYASSSKQNFEVY